MPQYLSPGVYVEEVPSAIQAIAGVGTSTAGFIGIAPAEIAMPIDALPSSSKIAQEALDLTKSADSGKTIPLARYPVNPARGSYEVQIADSAGAEVKPNSVALINDKQQGKSYLKVDPAVATGSSVKVDYQVLADSVTNEVIRAADGARTQFNLKNYPVIPSTDATKVTVKDAQNANVTVTAVKIDNAANAPTAYVEITPAPPAGAVVTVSYDRLLANFMTPETGAAPRLCTNFSEFTRKFGSFPTDVEYRNLVHAVYGFFNNGGTRCFVACVDGEQSLDQALTKMAAVDEVALVAAPGLISDIVRDKLVTHCKVTTKDRFAILDSALDIGDSPTIDNIMPPPNSDYAAFYFPWIKVFDPATRTLDPESDGRIAVPPSGHVAGIYARVDVNRGVHKAPANEPVLGALGLQYQISKAQQDGLNPTGINCIRDLNGNIRVWGARTVGGDANGEFRYVNVRRSMLFLGESIDEGLQWAVFEPNDLNLWAKITRNVSAFLTTQWRLGMLFGATAQEAFYVKCDAETNPPELREIGQVVTEIGVAIVRPAEFVIFRISQWQPQKSS
jgi:phage tail sheath protein FI